MKVTASFDKKTKSSRFVVGNVAFNVAKCASGKFAVNSRYLREPVILPADVKLAEAVDVMKEIASKLEDGLNKLKNGSK